MSGTYDVPAGTIADDTTPELIRAELIAWAERHEHHELYPVRGKKLDGILDTIGALDDILEGFMRETTP